ncbi:MAG: DUF2252 domain-containing protein [Synechococcus sp. WH 8007]|nr:DUF2252 domain-containing protein [Synechococcus sp. WH 8007]
MTLALAKPETGHLGDVGSAAPQFCSLEALGEWQPLIDRQDPISRIEEENSTRLPWLVPERHRRMAESPFAFFRGTAAQMAADLAPLPRSPHRVQLCGDAHLLNFGFYASPERSLVFDINDFDQTAPGPFEWDVKRLLVSVVLVARQWQLDREEQSRLARKVAGAYRKAMADYARLPTLTLWNRLLHVERFVEALPQTAFRCHLEAAVANAMRRSGRHAVQKHCEFRSDGTGTIRHEPPLIWRHALLDPHLLWASEPDLDPASSPSHGEAIAFLLERYRESLSPRRRHQLQDFAVIDTALKAVGVGSVGTRCAIALMKGPHPEDWLLLQSKQALPSCINQQLGEDSGHEGQRIVEGQRLIQCVSDPFLGWTSTPKGIPMVWRQLRDWKASMSLDEMKPSPLKAYAKLCASVLARAHARSGHRQTLHGALGDDKTFDRAMATFALGYADQVEEDHRALLQAMASGRLTSSD